MKKLIALALLAVPTVSLADYVDVLASKLNPGCSLDTYHQIVKEFNETWAKDYGYKAEVLTPVQSQSLGTLYWVGRIASASAFSKGLEAWMAGQKDPNSVAGKLGARMNKCATFESRAGYMTN